MTKPTLVRVLIAELGEDAEALDELRRLLAGPEPQRLLKTAEAAERLGVHPRTLVRKAADGLVVGAERVGAHAWRYDPASLRLLPPSSASPSTPAGSARGRSRNEPSAATLAIRGPGKRG